MVFFGFPETLAPTLTLPRCDGGGEFFTGSY